MHCPGENLDNPELLEGEGWRVLEAKRHIKKLKTGSLAANNFNLILREITQRSEVEKRLIQIQSSGVPNYFGSQRFGHGGQNLSKAEAVLLEGVKVKNRFLKGIYYSAARSFLFNQILDARVRADNWSKALSGDLMLLAGTNSFFQSKNQIQPSTKDLLTMIFRQQHPCGEGDKRGQVWQPWICRIKL